MKALVIGSSDIDLFISLPESSSYVQKEKDIVFTLGDKIPTDINAFALGGNGANVSVGLKRLGLESSFYTYVGTDLLSNQIKRTIEEEGVSLIDHEGAGDNTSINLIFNFKEDRIIFSHHEVKNHSFDEAKAKGFEALYLTSIGKEWEEAYKQINSYIHSQSMAVAFSPGSPQFANLSDIVYEIMAASKILFCNKEEGEKILEKKGESAADMKELLEKLSKLGPEVVSVTDGKEGSYAYENGSYYSISSFDLGSQGRDKTGAGDSYASAFFAANLLGHDIKTCMRWGAANANSVMGKVGAQAGLLNIEEIEKVLFDRPDFQPEML